MKNFQINVIPCLADNYGFLLADLDQGVAIAVDTPDDKVITEYLESKGWALSFILNTHHHHDHIGGNSQLKKRWDCQIFCSEYDFEKKRVPDADDSVKDGDLLTLGNFEVEVLGVPGHTLGHVAYYFPKLSKVFVGDTLFALGCGRLFEGTPSMMFKSLSKLMKLPDDTLVYCAHEYTKANLRFALTIEPNNVNLLTRQIEVLSATEKGLPTVPTSIGVERKTNPFLRTHSRALRNGLGMPDSNDVAIFGEIRKRKDYF